MALGTMFVLLGKGGQNCIELSHVNIFPLDILQIRDMRNI